MTDFSKRLDEIALEAWQGFAAQGFNTQDYTHHCRRAMLLAIAEFAKLEPSEEALKWGGSALKKSHPKHGGLSLTQSRMRMIYCALMAAQLKEIRGGRK